MTASPSRWALSSPPTSWARATSPITRTTGPGVAAAIGDPATEAILIAPSNPFLSVDQILAVPGIRDALAAAKAPVVAVSPLVGGQAVITVAALGVGTHTITVAYGGDSHFGPSTSGAFTQTVQAAPTSTTLRASAPMPK